MKTVDAEIKTDCGMSVPVWKPEKLNVDKTIGGL